MSTATDLPAGARRMVSATDYLLILTDHTDAREPAGWDEAVPLADGIRIEALEPALSTDLLESCEPRGLNWRPARQFGVIHAYVRDALPAEFETGTYRWDPTGSLHEALCLARLVRDNAASLEYAVRRIHCSDGTEIHVPLNPGIRVAFRLDPKTAGWLDRDDAKHLGDLLTRFRSPELDLPSRVSRALHYVEASAREQYLQDAQATVVRGLEALLKVGRSNLGLQFRERVPALARELGVVLTTDTCRAAYGDRSGVVHGALVDLSETIVLDSFASSLTTLQATLRIAIRTAIVDTAFADVFRNDATIVSRWPAVDPSARGGPRVI